MIRPSRVGRVFVQEPQHQGCQDQGCQDGHPNLHLEHLHEFEEGPGSDGFPQHDGDPRLVEVRSGH